MTHSMFGSEQEAKRFFVQKIVAEAAQSGRALSESEQWMLSFSETDPEFVVLPELVERLASEISDADYEAKITRLVERACRRDVSANKESVEQYRQALKKLAQGDHYLLVMLEPGLARVLPKWWQFWR